MKDEHIQKILKAYQERKDIDKFSHVASMEEVTEKGYNLNIPRYVDTFEDEEQVDILANKFALAVIEAKEAEVLEKANKLLALL